MIPFLRGYACGYLSFIMGDVIFQVVKYGHPTSGTWITSLLSLMAVSIVSLCLPMYYERSKDEKITKR